MSVHIRYRGPSPEGGAVLGEEDAGKDPAAAETCSISSSLLAGELVALGGISDPPPQVAENLARAAGAQVRRRRRRCFFFVPVARKPRAAVEWWENHFARQIFIIFIMLFFFFRPLKWYMGVLLWQRVRHFESRSAS